MEAKDKKGKSKCGIEHYGHPDFYKILGEISKLHSVKNYDYAHGGDYFGNFKRVASILNLYPGLNLSKPSTIAIVYMLKQLDAVLWANSTGYKPVAEGIEERWKDIATYSIIISILQREE